MCARVEQSSPVDKAGNIATNTPEEKKYSLRSLSQTPKKQRISTSKYFATPTPSPAKAKSPRPPRGTVSGLPFPALSAPQFGLVQEQLSHDPFRLLIAVTFLIRTHCRQAIPTFHTLMDQYPTPEALAEAEASNITAVIRHLGFGTVRAAQVQKYARIWVDNPPRRDVRYGVKNYPLRGDGADIRACEALPPEHEDPRESAWEIGHMTQGPYAIDSWRIFCRDTLLERGSKGGGEDEGTFQPEWMRVLPQDKELRAYLRWMWMREGWEWDPVTGDRSVLSEEMRSAVNENRVEWDNTGALRITNKADDAEDGLVVKDK
ncbi:DNA glycosylase [Xylariales sp. PMI_506]|nr:DNA glycosylase [Xylariales sp. PMI_506]